MCAVGKGAVGAVQVLSMVFYALYGLSISIVLKRFGAMTRTFINAAAIVLNAALEAARVRGRAVARWWCWRPPLRRRQMAQEQAAGRLRLRPADETERTQVA